MTKDELKTDEPKYIRELVIRDKVRKESEELIQRFEIANSMNCYMQLTPDRKQIGEMLVMIAEPREKRIVELEKENVELKKELKKWKDEWQEQVQKAIDEGYARTQQTIQLTKAKDLIEDMYDKIPASHSDYYRDVMERARQFLKDLEK
jgi:hypothetical protein